MNTLAHRNLNRTFKFLLLIVLYFAYSSIFPPPLYAQNYIHHDLKVSLDPATHRLSAVDTITLPEGQKGLRFLLHAGLNPASPDSNVSIVKQPSAQEAAPVESFIVAVPAGTRTFPIQYEGAIYHPVQAAGKNQARGFDETAGSIADEGVYLAGSSVWYPEFETDFITFTLDIQTPSGWDAVAQGTRVVHEKSKTSSKIRWDSPEPQQEIYLIASKFVDYEKKSGDLTAMVFLRTHDDALANKYLDATIRYVEMYDRLIGRYPYKKFALVENFWETGFGMPSFTLLGPTVLRLPFIINTSYPHEILHNWWGNSVYPVYEKGNWSEGLTAYLADHLLKEQPGAGAEYRMTSLQKYVDYASTARDFPLTQFTSRHSPSTEAVGYGKALLFFHMLRLELGDKNFIAAIRNFYQNYKFHFATFDDIQKTFETVFGRNLKNEFDQWITRTGAPMLRLSDVKSEKSGEGYIVSGKLEQVQAGDTYRLHIPTAVTMEGQERAFQTTIDMDGKTRDFSITVSSRPLRVDIDPEFDVFRTLDRDEIPPAISQALGAKKMLIVLPDKAGKDLLEGYEAFAKMLSLSGPDETEVKRDSELETLPNDRAVTILGWENRFLEKERAAWKGFETAIKQKSVTIGKNEIPKENHAFVLAARNPENREMGLMFIAADRPGSLPGLGRKLPHYHKYGYLAFESEEPSNIAKGSWSIVASPLAAFLPGSDGTVRQIERGKLGPREALASLPPLYSEERMMETVNYLSSDTLKGREIGTPEIDQAADFIAKNFRQAGLMPGGEEGSYFQSWTDPVRNITLRNVIGVIPGKKPQFARQNVVIGAHYDHLGMGMSLGRTEDKGKIHPGADDNASGVAVLLDLARVVKETFNADRTIIFIAFTGEEEGRLGSQYYVKNETRYPVSKCFGMVNLDTVGRLGNNKLLILGAASAKEWVHIFRGAGYVAGADVEIVSEELDSSDQKSFQEAGIPAVQLFSGPHLDYHRPTDTADKIDPRGLVKISTVAAEVIDYLVSREKPLAATAKPGPVREPEPKTERKVGLGTIPDFAYRGKGFRLSGVIDGSPAQAAGLTAGDVIITMNSTPVGSLKDFSDFLKTLKPGDRVSITFVRNGKESTVESTVKGR